MTTVHERAADIALLRDIWERPHVRDPRARAQAVTEAIAEKLARLAASLESRGFDQERVSRFLMRCVFTMFAEDVRLLRDAPFHRLIEIALPDPAEFAPAAEELWRAMDHGKRFGLRKLLRFNGHFFRHAEALPLTREDLEVLRDAAEKDWSDVEPAIFGTLLTRALDAKERAPIGRRVHPARVHRPGGAAGGRGAHSRAMDRGASRGAPAPREGREQETTGKEPKGGGETAARFPHLAAVVALPRSRLWLGKLPLCDDAHRQAHRGRGDERARRPHRHTRAPVSGGRSEPVLWHRSQTVGARDRGAHFVDRVPPVLAARSWRRPARRADFEGHGHAGDARCGAPLG